MKVESFNKWKTETLKLYPYLKEKMTSRSELQDYLDHEYQGKAQVIMKDEKITKAVAIIGVLDRKLPTTHWTLLINDGYKTIYIDSFGVVPPIAVWGQINSEEVFINTHKFQRFDSSLCGEYCLYLLYIFLNYSHGMLNAVIQKM